MGILRTDRITGLGGANAIKGSVFFSHDGDTSAGESGALQVLNENDALTFGTGDFTVEFWFYANRVGVVQHLYDNRGTGAGSNTAVLIRLSDSNNIQFFTTNAFRITGSTTIIANAWYHVALTRTGSTHTLYVNGSSDGTWSQSSLTYTGPTNNFAVIGSDDNRDGRYGLNGYISNLRVAKELIYSAAFTVPTAELAPTTNTTLLCCQSPGNVNESFGDPILTAFASNINSQGPVASRFTPNSPVGFSTTTDVGSQYGATFDGFGNFATSTYMVPPGGNTRERNRGRAVFSGGYTGPSGSGQTGTTTMEYFQIQSGGRSIDFGTLSEDRKFSAALGSATRGVVGGSDGTPGWVTGTMEFVTIANESNTTTFGNMTAVGGMVSACSSNTRGIFFSVWDASGSGPAHKGHIDYITIATAGNSADFGQLSVSRPEAAGFSSPTRGICAGGYPAPDGTVMSNVIDFITIATTGNASDFGDLTQARQAVSGASSQTRGVVAAGAVYGSPSYTFNINTIDYVTIASTGNATDFGDLSAGATGKSVGNCSNQIRGVFGGGKSSTPTYINTVEFINIAATGNAFDFGDLTRTPAYGSVMCDSHGGLS